MSSRGRKNRHRHEYRPRADSVLDRLSLHARKNHIAYLLAAAMLLLFRYSPSGWLALGFAVIVMLVYQYNKYDSRIPIALALLLLVISAFVLLSSEALANDLATYTYYLLVVGVILEAADYIREGRKNHKEVGIQQHHA